jgi:hypothetical protein
MCGWMDDTLKASPTWTFLSFLQEQFSFITIKRDHVAKWMTNLMA